MQKHRPQFRIPAAEEIEAVVCRLKQMYRGKSIAENDLAQFLEEIKGEMAKINVVCLLPLETYED